jgi:hypothetical protein
VLASRGLTALSQKCPMTALVISLARGICVLWIVTDNIYKETWRRLLEFSNTDFTLTDITARHGSANSGSEKSNYRKQAAQVRATILQAKEYFDAARSSSIFTSPNHLYYGFVALSSTMMLLLGDGTRSLDRLRQEKTNAHHGLVFSTGCTSSTAVSGLSLLENTFAEILERGHFGNWYSVLRDREPILATHRLHNETLISVNRISAGFYPIRLFSS